MRLLLIRHGRSAHRMPGGLLDHHGMRRWLAEYDDAGIVAHEAPPARLVADVASADVVAASDMPRALASAGLLAPGRRIEVVPLFREEPLPLASLGPLRLPLVLWALATHLRWMQAILRSTDTAPAALHRAREAIRWCHAAGDEATVAVVTHGVFRRIVAGELRRAGWRVEPGWQGYAHWSVWRFRTP